MSGYAALLIHTCTIKRVEDTLGTAKRPIHAYSMTVASNVACRIEPLGGDARDELPIAMYGADHLGYFLPGALLQNGDLVVVAAGDYAGSYYTEDVDKVPGRSGVLNLQAVLTLRTV